MRARSKVWTKLAARGEFSMDVKAIINGVEFTKISAPKIDRTTMSRAMSVGNCCNASLEFSVLLEEGQSIPKGAEITIKAQLYDDNIESEWKEFGTFYIDDRNERYEGLVEIIAYDAMMKIDQPFVADDNYNTLGWPLPMSTVVKMVAERIGVAIDPRTQIKTGPDYVVDLPSNYTVREVMSGIACCHGGNWIITEDNMLRLVPLIQVPNETYKIITSDYEDIILPPGNTLVWKKSTDTPVADITKNSVAKVSITDKARKDFRLIDHKNNFIVTNDGHTLVWAKNGDIYATNGMINVPVVIGELNTSTSLVVSNVLASRTVLQTEVKESSSAEIEETESSAQNVTTTFYAKKGNNNGEVLDAGDCPYMTQQICDDLYEEFAGLVYAPYTATKTIYDPATEIGDQIKIGDTVHSVVYNTSIVLDRSFISDLAIPSQEESTSEYPQNSVEAKIKDLNVKLTSQILRLDNSITLKVKAVQDDLDDLDVNRVAKIELAVSPNGIGSTISACAGTISLTAGKLLITSGNFLLDKNGTVTINNGKFKGTVETGVDDNRFGVKLEGSTIKIMRDDTDYLKIMSSDWGKGSNPNAPFGAQIRSESFLAFNDMSGNMYVAINYGANPNGFARCFLCFDDAEFCDDVQFDKKLILGGTNGHEIRNSGTNVSISTGLSLDGRVYADGFYFNSPPIDSSSSTSLGYLLQVLWNKVFG